MYNPAVYIRIVQNLQTLYEQGFLPAGMADQILMQSMNGMGSIQMIMNSNCSNYGYWLNNGLIPQKPTMFDNYACAHPLTLSKNDIKETVANYLKSQGKPIYEIKTISTVLQKHACKAQGVIALEPQFIVLNLINSYRSVMFYYCEHCNTAYVVDDTLTPIGISIPFDTIYRKQLTIQNISKDYVNMEMITNQRMLFSTNAAKFMDGEMTLQMVEPSLYNMQSLVTPMQMQEIRKLIICGNSVKKVFDTFFYHYVNQMNKNYLPFRRTRFDNDGNALEVRYTKPEKIIGMANCIINTYNKPITSVMKLGESLKKHACKSQGIIPVNEMTFNIFNGQTQEENKLYYCEHCGKLMYIDGETMADSIADEPLPPME